MVPQAAQDTLACQISCLANEVCQSLRVREGRTVSHVQRIRPGHHRGSALIHIASQIVPHCSEVF